MSCAYPSGRNWRVFAFFLALGAASGAQTTRAASFAIDIDPSSPTLGDLLDRESKSKLPAKPSTSPRTTPDTPVQATPPAPRSISSEPIVPRNAVRVNVPRAKSRAPLPPTRPKPQHDIQALAPTSHMIARPSPVASPVRDPAPVLDMPAPPSRPAVHSPTQKLISEAHVARQPEALPPALETHVPMVRPSPRKIEIPPPHPQAKANASRNQAALLRDPTITNSSEPPEPVADGRAKSVTRLLEDDDEQAPPPAAPAPRVVLPPLEEPARAAPPRSAPSKAASAAKPVAPKPTEAPKVPVSKVEPPKGDSVKPEGTKVESGKTDPTAQVASETKSATAPDKIVYVIDQDLRQFLTDFARRSGLRSDIAANVRGRLNKVKLPAEPNALLRELERRFDFEWIIEGEILKVSSRAEMATRILPLGPLSYDDLLREMKNADIDVARYPMRKLGDSNAIFVTAPATHIGRIAALFDVLKAGKTVGPDLRIVRNGITRKVEWD